MNIPGYDAWKTQSPYDSEECEYCGAWPDGFRGGWSGVQPDSCTGECGRRWRDPDAEREDRADRDRDG